MNKLPEFHIYALQRTGHVLCVGDDGWQNNNPTSYISLTSARLGTKALVQPFGPPGTLDSYIWSVDHGVSFPIFFGGYALTREAEKLRVDGHICPENAELLSRLPFDQWQEKLTYEAVAYDIGKFGRTVEDFIKLRLRDVA